MSMPARVASHVLIVASAPVDPALLTARAQMAGALICADGGAEPVFAAGLRPDLVVGDMDSITPSLRDRLMSEDILVVQHPPEKDQTDMELAIEHALAYAPTHLTILGALGGARLDHTVGNLLLLAQSSLRAIDIRMETERSEALAVWSEREVTGAVGEYVSLLPLTASVEGIQTSGLRYALHGEALMQGYARGVSNELTAERATITVSSGCLLVIHERMRAGVQAG